MGTLGLILADGDAPTRAELDTRWPGWADDVGTVIAADGGARHAAPLGLVIDRWVGDGDSVEPALLERLGASGVPIERLRPDKDESDTELAVRAAIEAGVDGLLIVGAFGGERLDHALANLTLPASTVVAGRPVVFLTAAARLSWLVASSPHADPTVARLAGRVGDLVSLLPMAGDAEGITTAGLEYPLTDEPLHAGSTRGLSNVISANGATVTLRRGRLLVVETPATLGR